jgi:hypothetical protein
MGGEIELIMVGYIDKNSTETSGEKYFKINSSGINS